MTGGAALVAAFFLSGRIKKTSQMQWHCIWDIEAV